MPLTEAEARQIAENQSRKIYLTPAQNAALTPDDIRLICRFLPLQVEPFIVPDVAGRPMLVRNLSHVRKAAARELAERLLRIAQDIESRSGHYFERRADLNLHAGIASKDHKIGALAGAVGEPFCDAWREESVSILKSLAESALDDPCEGDLECLGVVRSYGEGGAVFAEEEPQ